MGEINLFTDFDQFFSPPSPRYILHPFFSRHISSKQSDTKMAFIRHADQEKINFVCCLSSSQKHTLARLGNWCFPPCFATNIKTCKWSYRWNHKWKVKTKLNQISSDAKSICFNPFVNYVNNTSRWGGGMVVPQMGRQETGRIFLLY